MLRSARDRGALLAVDGARVRFDGRRSVGGEPRDETLAVFEQRECRRRRRRIRKLPRSSSRCGFAWRMETGDACNGRPAASQLA